MIVRGSTFSRVILAATALVTILLPVGLATAGHHHAAAPKTNRISIKSGGNEVNADNDFGSVSGHGRFVTFESTGRFESGDDGFDDDVFLHDKKTQKTRRVSVRSGGKEAPGVSCDDSSISADGNVVAFDCDGPLVSSDTNGTDDVYARPPGSASPRRARS